MKKLTILLTAILIFGLTLISAQAAEDEPSLKWEASTGNVIGYIIYYGVVEGEYSFSQNVGDVTTYPNIITNLKLNSETDYLMVVRAYNDGGESGDSNVVAYTTPAVVVPPWTPPVNNNPEPVPPVIIEIPENIQQLILNFN